MIVALITPVPSLVAAIAASAADDSGERILRLDGGNQLLRGPSQKHREPLRRSA